VPVVPVEAWVIATHAKWPVMLSAGLFCSSSGVYAIASSQAQRDRRSALFAASEIVRAGGGLLAWSILHEFVGVGGAVSVLAGATAGTLAAIALLVGRVAPGLLRTGRSSRRLLGFYWRYGWPMSLWLATSAAMIYVDRFVIDAFLGHTAAGRYAAVADMIVRGMGMLAFPVTMAVHPAVMAAWNVGRPDLARAILRSSARVLNATLLAGLAASAIAGPWMLGKAMSGDGPNRGLVIVLATGAALWQFALLAHKGLEIAGRSVLMLRLIVLAAAVSAALSTVLVPAIGVLGAATAFTLGAACYTIACLLVGPRMLRGYVAAAHRDPARKISELMKT
jgi:O-antigen/teichoic acid export membrane protein